MPSRRQLLATSGAALTGALAGCADIDENRFSPGSDADTDWPMPRRNPGNTAFAPDAVAPREGASERWTHEGGFDVRTPVIAGGTAYVPTAEALVALDTDDGAERWRFAPGDQPWPTPPVVHDGTVFVTASDEDTVHALDAESGDELWSLGGDGHVHASPHLLAGRLTDEPSVLAGDANGRVAALDPATGEAVWTVDLFGAVRAFAYRAPMLYVGTSSGEVSVFFVQERDRPREQ